MRAQQGSARYVALSGGVGGAKLRWGSRICWASDSPSSSTRVMTSSISACTSRPMSTPPSTRWPTWSIQKRDGDGATRRGRSCRPCRGLAGLRGSTGRCRPGNAYRTHAAAADGRDIDQYHGSSGEVARRQIPHPADVRRAAAHGGRYRPGHACLSGILRARAVPAGDPLHPLRGRARRQAFDRGSCSLADPALAGIIVCPSNPWLSVDPILAVPGLREAMRASGRPIIAVSPIIAGKAVKGPTAKIMQELALHAGAVNIARHYAGLIDGFVLDARTRLVDKLVIPMRVARTLMRRSTIGLASLASAWTSASGSRGGGKAKAAPTEARDDMFGVVPVKGLGLPPTRCLRLRLPDVRAPAARPR